MVMIGGPPPGELRSVGDVARRLTGRPLCFGRAIIPAARLTLAE
jgi:hypothetical protein